MDNSKYITNYSSSASIVKIKERVLKVVIGGDGGIGKTSILRMLCDDHFNDDEDMTITSDFFVKRLKVDGIFVNLQIWDLAGQDRFRFLLDTFTKGAVGAILGFDVKRRQSFADLEEWISLVRTHDPDIPIVLVATKVDLKYNPALSPQMAREFAEAYGFIGFLETSTKAGLNVEAPFEMIINHLRARES